jgi:sortase (surface protein transpeptidase)
LIEVDGRIATSGGVLLPGATVELRCGDRSVASVVADAEGYYAIQARATPPCRLEAWFPEYGSEAVERVVTGTYNFALDLAPGVVTILASDARTGLPLEGVDVAVRVAGGSDLAATLPTDAEGVAWIPDLAPMSYRVTARAPGYAPKTMEVLVGPEASQVVPLRFSLGLQGTVVATVSGRPIPHASISVYRLGASGGSGDGRSIRAAAIEDGLAPVPGIAGPLPARADLGDPVAVGVADDVGYYWIDILDEGEYFLVAEGEGWSTIPEGEDRGSLTRAAPVLDTRLELSPVFYGRTQEMPARIAFPKLGMQGPVVRVGVDRDGTMTAPTNPDTIGWFAGSSGMWTRGNLILAGHINWSGQTRLFGFIERLVPGDEIVLLDARGASSTYRVEWNTIVGAGYSAGEIIAQGSREEVTLITCDGPFDTAIRAYLGRRVVRGVRIG